MGKGSSLFIVLVALSTYSSFAFSIEQCSSVKLIYENTGACDSKNVTLTGEVAALGYYTSANGHDYTTFVLDDGTATPLRVFSYTRLPVSDGDFIKVKGEFHKERPKGNYTFYMEIATSPEDVFVIRRNNTKVIVGGLLFAAILSSMIFVLYKQRKDKKDTRYESGSAFESYVLSLFDQRDWKIAKSAGYLTRKLGRIVESDSDPDFLMRHKDTNKLIAVECKYKSHFVDGTKEEGTYWAPEYQIKHYNAFSEKERCPVFIAIGCGSAPSKPEHLYLVPLYALKYSFASKTYLERFERDPKKQFSFEEFKKKYQSLL